MLFRYSKFRSVSHKVADLIKRKEKEGLSCLLCPRPFSRSNDNNCIGAVHNLYATIAGKMDAYNEKTESSKSANTVKPTFYKRKLPSPPATEFSSPEGRKIFQEALLQGTMNGFFKLIEQYSTQDEPAYCGLASIAMVLNALSIDPRRTWKGSWRWFHEELLDCCKPLQQVKADGIVFSQAASLARCNGAKVLVRPWGSFTLEEFREMVVDVTSKGERHMIISYSRRPLGQTGDGHYSPVGGYHAPSDSLLILDVARFKYPPHWVPLSLIYEAMGVIDKATNSGRGFMVMESQPLLDSVVFTLEIRGNWREAHTFIAQEALATVENLAATSPDLPIESVLERVVSSAPMASVMELIAVRGSGNPFITSSSARASMDDPNRSSSPGPLRVTPPHACGNSRCSMEAEKNLKNSTSVWSNQLSPAKSRDQSPSTASPKSSFFASITSGTTSSPSPPNPTMCWPRMTPCYPLTSGFSPLGGIPDSLQAGISTQATSLPEEHICAKESVPPHLLPQLYVTGVTGTQERCIPARARQQLLDELCALPLFQLVSQALRAKTGGELEPLAAERLTTLLLLPQPSSWFGTKASSPPSWGSAWLQLIDCRADSVLAAELRYLREQLEHIENVARSGTIEALCAGVHGCETRLDCAAHGHA